MSKQKRMRSEKWEERKSKEEDTNEETWENGTKKKKKENTLRENKTKSNKEKKTDTWEKEKQTAGNMKNKKPKQETHEQQNKWGNAKTQHETNMRKHKKRTTLEN